MKGYCDGLDRKLIANWDATQFIVSDEYQQKGIYIKAERVQHLTAPSVGTLGFAVKTYHLSNAAGYSAHLFVVAPGTQSLLWRMTTWPTIHLR